MLPHSRFRPGSRPSRRGSPGAGKMAAEARAVTRATRGPHDQTTSAGSEADLHAASPALLVAGSRPGAGLPLRDPASLPTALPGEGPALESCVFRHRLVGGATARSPRLPCEGSAQRVSYSGNPGSFNPSSLTLASWCSTASQKADSMIKPVHAV